MIKKCLDVCFRARIYIKATEPVRRYHLTAKYTAHETQNDLGTWRGWTCDRDSPSSSNLMSLAACIPSSFKFFSICLLRASAARSSADIAQPIPDNEKEHP